MAEADRLGRDKFLARHGRRRALWWEVRHDGREYDSKAIVVVARGYQYGPSRQTRTRLVKGGDATAARALRRLGFTVVDTRTESTAISGLEVNVTYSWADLGARFGFEPGWLNRVGGMAVSTPRGAFTEARRA